MGKRWSSAKEAELTRLVNAGTFTYPEIAKIMGLNKNQIATKAQSLGLNNSVYRKRITKHMHLHEVLLRYYLNHTAEETQERFGLTASEFKSCLTYAYRRPELKHLRKETRPHTAWSNDDWIFMARHVGIQPREWITKKLKRGQTYNAVKDALAKFRGHGKYMNGMPVGWATVMFADETVRRHSIRTKAGPTGDRGQFFYRIIPWVICERLLLAGELRRELGKGKCTDDRRRRAPKIQVHPEVRAGIRGMARFQRWIHGTESDQVVVRRIRRALRQR
jgi:hypothetical protein